MPTGISGYQGSGARPATTGSIPSRTPATGVAGGATDPGRAGPGMRSQAGAAAVGPQPPMRDGWEVPDRPVTVASARDLRAMQKQQGRAAGRKRRVSPLLLVGVAAFCLAAAAGAFFYTRSVHRQMETEASGAEAPKPAPRPGPIYSFEPFIVNVAGTDGTRYLKASITVECADRKASADIAAAEYKVRDAVLAVLSAYELGDLTDVSKRDAIRHRVADAIEQSISGGRKGPDRVRGVYFLEFVIQ